MQILTNIRKRHEADLLASSPNTNCSTGTDAVSGDNNPDAQYNTVAKSTSRAVDNKNNNATNANINKAV